MPLDLANNGQAVQYMSSIVGRNRSYVRHVLQLFLQNGGFLSLFVFFLLLGFLVIHHECTSL